MVLVKERKILSHKHARWTRPKTHQMESLSSHKKMKDMMDSSTNGEQVRRCCYCIKWKV